MQTAVVQDGVVQALGFQVGLYFVGGDISGIAGGFQRFPAGVPAAAGQYQQRRQQQGGNHNGFFHPSNLLGPRRMQGERGK